MALQFPDMNFSWLGDIGGQLRQGYERGKQGDILSQMEGTSPEDYEKAAVRAFKANQPELALRLNNAALARRELARRGVADALYMQMAPGMIQMYRNRPGADGGSGVGSGDLSETPDLGGSPAQPATPAPTYNWPRPQSMVAPPSVAAASMPSQTEPLPQSPSEELLARAEGPMPGQQGQTLADLQPMRLAQMGGTPPMPQPQPPAQIPGMPVGPDPRAGGLPPWAQGATMPTLPGQPDAQPQAPTLSPPTANQFPGDPQRLARAQRSYFDEMLFKLGPKGLNTPIGRAAIKGLDAAEEALKPTPDEKKYFTYRRGQAAKGERAVDINTWMQQERNAPEEHKLMLKGFEGYRAERMKGEDLNNTLNVMERILERPEMISGPGSASFTKVTSGLNNLLDIAKRLGVPADQLPGVGYIRGLKTTAQLTEAYNALANQAIFAKLGTLGNNISEGDRNFINAAFPSLSMTPEGNALLIKIMREAANRAIEAGKAAERYKRGNPRATIDGMDEAVRNWAEENSGFVKGGKLTDAGKTWQAQIDALSPKAAPPPPTGGGTQAPTLRYDPRNPKPIMGPGGVPHIVLPDGRIVPASEAM